MLHLDPTTPLGVLDTVGHLAPLASASAGGALLLSLGRFIDRVRGK